MYGVPYGDLSGGQVCDWSDRVSGVKCGVKCGAPLCAGSRRVGARSGGQCV